MDFAFTFFIWVFLAFFFAPGGERSEPRVACCPGLSLDFLGFFPLLLLAFSDYTLLFPI